VTLPVAAIQSSVEFERLCVTTPDDGATSCF
jgi:hypothetical protein